MFKKKKKSSKILQCLLGKVKISNFAHESLPQYRRPIRSRVTNRRDKEQNTTSSEEFMINCC